MSNNFERMKNKIIEASENKDYNEAVKEWDVIDRDEVADSNCICGKDIKICYRIKNRINGNIYYPIGSDCIFKFKNETMTKTVKDFERVWCDDCRCYIVTKFALKEHYLTYKHRSNGRRCITEGCNNKIRIDEPEWKTRCIGCYKKSKNISKKNLNIIPKELKINE